MLLILAQDGGAAGGGQFQLIFFALIAVAFYFFLIRPQRKRQQAVQQMQKALSVGDDVVTIGGLHGRVESIGETTVDLEVTDEVVMRFKRSAIAEIVGADTADSDAAVDGSENA